MKSEVNYIKELLIVFMLVIHNVIKLDDELFCRHSLLVDLEICVKDIGCNDIGSTIWKTRYFLDNNMQS